MVGPDFETPETKVAEQWTDDEDQGITRQPIHDAEWWQVFNDPVLDTLVQTAYEQNLDLQIAGLRVLEARA